MNTVIQPEHGGSSTFYVQDASRVLKFTGVLLSEISTETRTGPRWLEMDLYKRDPDEEHPRGLYVLHLVGRSVVYHTHRSACNRGIPRTPTDTDWAADAEPCRDCSPPYWALKEANGYPQRDPVTRELKPDPAYTSTQFDLEMDRHTSYICATADEVVEQLKESSRHQRSPSTLSAPAQRLLDAAALIDADVAKAITVVEEI
jgi:hypothetical protein